MGDLFPCIILERKVKIKTIEVERIALGVVRIFRVPGLMQRHLCILTFFFS